jgi:two-component system cell cycle sensor histidine kinase/response regulator CckA
MRTDSGYLLIVEDDPDIRKLLDTTLTFRGYRVVSAQNGREALDIAQKEHPEIVVADIMMPELDGFGLVHRLRIDPATRGIPVVFITATYVADEDREFALKIGATRFIQKPVDLDQFLKTIGDLFERGPHTAVQPLDEVRFYEGYRERLRAKLKEKTMQIAREERLLETVSSLETLDIQMSLRHAVRERDELKILLEEIDKQLERVKK